MFRFKIIKQIVLIRDNVESMKDGELKITKGSSGLGGSGVEYSIISKENDDYTKRTYKIESSYDFLDGASDDIHSQVKSMEAQDSQLSEKRKSFDNDLER